MTRPRVEIPGVLYRSAELGANYLREGALTQETLASAFRDVVHRFPERICVGEIGRTSSYREIDEQSDRLGAALLELGLMPLDRAVFQLSNSKELLIAYLGCLKAGIIPICTLTAHRRHEIAYLADHAKARAHFVDGEGDKFDLVKFALEIREEVASLAFIISGRGAAARPGVHDLDALVSGMDSERARRLLASVEHDPWQVAIFQLSGGTTGVPKIIPRFHNEYLASIRDMIRWNAIDETLVAFTPSPMMHNAPMICYWGPALFSGGEIAITPSLEPEIIGRLIRERRPNWICMPGVVYLRLKSSGVLDTLDFSHVKASIVPSGALAMMRLTGAPAISLFGMTEGLICFGRVDDPPEAIAATVGRPVSKFDELKLLRPGTLEECAEGEIGELVIKGPGVIRGYYDAEERNKEAFTLDGFYRSGDLVGFKKIGGERFLTFEGRLKDVVSRGGEKINCMEVETVALAHPSIGSIAIVPMPDPAYEERACAFVVPTPGAEPISVEALGRFLESAGLAKFKWPERIEIVTDLPMTSSGKVSKPMLKEIIATKIREEGSRP